MEMMKRSDFFQAINRARLVYRKDPNHDVRAALVEAGVPAPPVGLPVDEIQLWMHPIGAAVSSGISSVSEPDPFFYLAIAEKAWEWYSEVWYPQQQLRAAA